MNEIAESSASRRGIVARKQAAAVMPLPTDAVAMVNRKRLNDETVDPAVSTNMGEGHGGAMAAVVDFRLH